MAQNVEQEIPFWFDSQRKGATEQEISDAEIHIGYKLPPTFRDLLKKRNGGVSNFTGFEDGDTYLPLLPILGVGASTSAGTLMSSFDVRREFEIPDGIIVFSAQGDAWWGFDYSSGSPPAIVFRGDSEDPLVVAAADFQSFLTKLIEE